MSTILDSLKKSSDKRDDNSKNSIDSFSFSNNGHNRNSKSYVIIILMLLTAAILYLGYQYLYSDEEPQQIGMVESKLVEVGDTELESKEGAEIGTKAGTLKKDKPNSSDVKQRIKEIKERRNKQQKALQAMQKPPAKHEDTQIIVNESVVSNPKETQKISSEHRAPQQQPVSNSTQLSEVTQPQDTAAAQTYLYAYQLPFSIRKDIPKLKLNVHVFDKDPDNRIAIINGVRFAIDDMIDDVVLVKDIVPEGVLMEFNNRVFLIPK